ncbi:hypothetical protein [Bradyrhizobium retamae]|uniref:hypothetical protein n=1 Tax=Bradyrhizobium retamae TaxID=1300035 RepID=UPI0012E348E3|nr:hypothetical protein [Bradyrhizobium retamae]
MIAWLTSASFFHVCKWTPCSEPAGDAVAELKETRQAHITVWWNGGSLGGAAFRERLYLTLDILVTNAHNGVGRRRLFDD